MCVSRVLHIRCYECQKIYIDQMDKLDALTRTVVLNVERPSSINGSVMYSRLR